MYHNAEEGLTREQDLFSGLKLLATICSSQSIHWNDAEKHHYLDSLSDSKTLAEYPVPYDQQNLDNNGHAPKVVSEVAPNPMISPSKEERSVFTCNADPCAPSSPTLYLLSSPATTHMEFFSTPPRSSTIATSSPFSVFDSVASRKLNETFSSKAESRPIRTSPGLSTPRSKGEDYDINSASPLPAPNFLSLAKDMELSPLSSLMSSSLNSASGKESFFHDDLSLTSQSPPFDDPREATSSQFSKSRRTRMNASHKNKPLNTLRHEPTLRKERRKDLSSPLASRSSSFRNSQHKLSILTNGSPKSGEKLVTKHRRGSRKHATLIRRKTKVKATQKQITTSDKENLQSELFTPEETLKGSLEGLAMTGFLVETLALSRASAMIPSELLRAVLRSQPQLKEEHPETEWLDIIRKILHDVKMFGTVKREGLDATDSPLEDEWFYIPENDRDQSRASLLKGLMPPKRTVTKQSKQYYFEPITKLTRWDPESD